MFKLVCWLLLDEYCYKQCGPGWSDSYRGISSGFSVVVKRLRHCVGLDTCYWDSLNRIPRIADDPTTEHITNSVDLDGVPQNSAFHRGLHWLISNTPLCCLSFLFQLQSLVFCWILNEYFCRQCGTGLSAPERGISSGSTLGVMSVLSVQGTCYDDS